jgi:hypothetical protein
MQRDYGEFFFSFLAVLLFLRIHPTLIFARMPPNPHQNPPFSSPEIYSAKPISFYDPCCFVQEVLQNPGDLRRVIRSVFEIRQVFLNPEDKKKGRAILRSSKKSTGTSRMRRPAGYF